MANHRVRDPRIILRLALPLLTVVLSCTSNTPEANGGSWELAPLPVDEGVLMSGIQSDSGPHFVVGGYPGHGLLLARGAQDWTVVADFPEMLHWIHAYENMLLMVGAKGLFQVRTNDGALVEYPQLATDVDLWGVYAISDTDIWVVGGKPRRPGETHAVIFRYHDGRWTTIALPELDRPCPSLFKVWARDSTDVYFVGANGVLLHFDGERVKQIPLEFGDDLIALWGTQEALLVVGGRTRGVIVHQSDNQWRPHFLAETSGLNGIAINGDECVAVGHQGTVVHFTTADINARLIRRPVGPLLHGVFRSDQYGFMAVGGTLDQPLPWQPILLEGNW